MTDTHRNTRHEKIRRYINGMIKTMPKLIVGNWKMNELVDDATQLAEKICHEASNSACDIVLCPPATLLYLVQNAVKGSDIATGGQDCHTKNRGAYTGDISAAMLADIGATYVIVGHSERRRQHGETDHLVAGKAAAAIRAGLVPIVCVGETADIREAGDAEVKVCAELSGSLAGLAPMTEVVVAYEPIWAIGTGESCGAPQITSMHAALKVQLQKLGFSGSTRILYGGSVKADNAAAIMALPNVGGVLVGGASLSANEFLSIIAAANKNAVGPEAATG
jgi:triosephosphate isomerase